MKSHDAMGDPSETVMYEKQRRMVLATMKYLQEERLERDIRFDVISVVGRARAPPSSTSENAFDAGF